MHLYTSIYKNLKLGVETRYKYSKQRGKSLQNILSFNIRYNVQVQNMILDS
jgi:uncharacterized protein YeaC (DUF1315 family)